MLILACSAPLSASALLEQFHPDKDADAIADEWYAGFREWAQKRCESDDRLRLWTWFRKRVDGRLAPARYRIDSVDRRNLYTHELLVTGEENGEVKRAAVPDETVFKWSDWQPVFVVSTWGPDKNRKDADIVALACWLYTEREDELANRVLSSLHQRIESLRAAIEDFIREMERHDTDDDLIVADRWDDVFKRYHKSLVPAGQAEKLEKARRKRAERRFEELKEWYHNPALRELTLAQLEHELEQWRRQYDGLEVVGEKADALTGLLRAVAKDAEKAGVWVDLATAKAHAEHPDAHEIARMLNKAVALDPYNLALRSRAADAWYEYAHPHVWETRGRVVADRESDLQKAIDHYDEWLKQQPLNLEVMLNKAICLHARGDTTDAEAIYRDIIRIDRDPELTSRARVLRKML